MVPTVDVALWDSGTSEQCSSIAAEFGRACEEFGFLQLVGHGLSSAVASELRDAADALFALPIERKLELRPPSPEVNRGYSAKGTESLAYSLGAARPPDLFEAFNIGMDDNIWPADVPAVRIAVERFFDELRPLIARIEAIIELALDLEPGWFAPRTDRSVDVLRLVRYERAADEPDPLPEQMRMGAHTDYGIFTTLLADSMPGLQIVGPDGEWLDVIPEPDAVVINIGDALAMWTNDRWRSTLHRVVPGDGLRRSFPFFHDGNFEAVIECLPSCLAPGEKAKYPPVTIGEHIANKVLSGRTLATSTSVQTATHRLPD
jgi:isopenicillin N synthase-like dioxygenase